MGSREAEEPCRAGAVSVELRRATEEVCGAWAAEAKETGRAGAVSLKVHGAGATEVEE